MAQRASWTRYSSAQRYLFLTILLLVAISNYFDYFVISVLLEPIKLEFHVSDASLGILSGLCFAILYAVTAIPIARWADRGNRRTVITFALAAWSTMTALCGSAHSFWQLAAARVAVGAVEPGALPPAQSLIIDYFPPEKRASATAIVTQGGSAMGWLLGVGLGGYLAAVYGWRTTLFYAGIPGLLLACLAWLLLREPREYLWGASGVDRTPCQRIGGNSSEPELEGALQAMRSLRDKPAYVMLVAGVSIYAVFTYGLATFLPSFMVRSLHVTLQQVALPWGTTIAVANLGGALIGGQLADRLGLRDPRWYAWIPALGCVMDLPLYALALCANHLGSFIVLDFVAELVIAAGMPPVFVALQAVSGKRRRTLAVACALLMFSLLGSGVGPPIAGLISDTLQPIYGSESLRYALFIILLFLLPAALMFQRAGSRLPRDVEDWAAPATQDSAGGFRPHDALGD